MFKNAQVVSLVFLGGALGSGLRFLVGLNLAVGPTLFAVNLLGTFLLGLVNGRDWKSWVHPFLGTGVAGGFTTLSGLALFVANEPINICQAALMIALGFASHWVGMRLVRRG
jgi:CrcB protein